MSVYLIWSEEHGAWWRPHQRGYTRAILEAGMYSSEVAREIIADAQRHSPAVLKEVMVPDPFGRDLVKAGGIK